MHSQSASSLQTANTETLERLGGTMDIIQRDGTQDSQYALPTGEYPLDDANSPGAGGGRPLFGSEEDTRARRIHAVAGYNIFATSGMSDFLSKHGVSCKVSLGFLNLNISEEPKT